MPTAPLSLIKTTLQYCTSELISEGFNVKMHHSKWIDKQVDNDLSLPII